MPKTKMPKPSERGQPWTRRLTLPRQTYNLVVSNMTARLIANCSPNLPPVELISVHISKCAGITFGQILAKHYPTSLFMDYERGRPLHPDFVPQDLKTWRSEQASKAAELPAGTRAIHGHFWAGKYDPIFPRAKKIVWLRDPVRRLTSQYYYMRARPSWPYPNAEYALVHEKKLSLIDFARLPAVQNVVTTRWLRDTPLSTFDFVGIQEHLAEDVAWLGRKLGWKRVTVPWENRTVHPEYEFAKIDPATLKEIERLNAADVELYREALASRQARAGKMQTLLGLFLGKPRHPSVAKNA
jgi:hypothetical protein